MAVTTGRYVLPHPASEAEAAATRANRTADRAVDRIPDRATDRKERDPCGCVFASDSILAKCKTAPAMLLVLAMLKV
jgi:hypothetical protein